MAQVWELDLPPHQQIVLLAMADHANADGRGCYPGIDRLAWKTGRSPRTVQRTLRAMEDPDGCGAAACPAALVAPTRHRKGGRGRATEYVLMLHHGVLKAPLEECDPVQSGLFEVEPERVTPTVAERVTPTVVEPERVTPVTVKGDAHVTPTISEPPTTPRPTVLGEREPSFIALAEATDHHPGSLTRSAERGLHVALADIRHGSPGMNGALPAEIRLRAARYRRTHPSWDLTPFALAKWWPTLTQDRAPPGVRDRAAEILAQAIGEVSDGTHGGEGDGGLGAGVLPAACAAAVNG